MLADYFEQIVKRQTKDPQTTSHWFTGELQAHLKDKGAKLMSCPCWKIFQIC